MDKFGQFMLALIFVAINMLYGGWILSILWRWIIVPQFGLRQLLLGEAILVRLFVSYLKGFGKIEKTDSDVLKKLTQGFCYNVAWGAFILALAWIVIKCS